MTAKPAHLLNPHYRPDIDGLRALAILAVVVFHAFPSSLKGGFVGVDIFFVISGFLISTIIFNNLERDRFTFIEFYARRIRRIFPALLVVLFSSLIFGWFALLSDEYKQLGKHVAGGAGFVSNFVLWNESGYFDNVSETKPLLHLWSLGIEEQFYIIWPLFLWAAWKRHAKMLAIVLVVTFLSFVYNITTTSVDPVAAFYSPLSRFWQLFVGAILAYLTLHKQSVKEMAKEATAFVASQTGVPFCFRINKETAKNILSGIGIVLIIVALFEINKKKGFPGWWAVLPTMGTVFVIAAGAKAWVNRVVLSHPVAVWFGLISFPLYMWHWPLLSFARIIESGTPHQAIRWLVVIVAINLALATYVFIEQPLRSKPLSKTCGIILLVLMALLGAAGSAIYLSEGVGFRDASKLYVNNSFELLRVPKTDAPCQNYIQQTAPAFAYCRYSNVGGAKTVAIIGDSHAHVAFAGIAKTLAVSKINVVVLASSGCPSMTGDVYREANKQSKACLKETEDIMRIVLSKPEISDVFIVTRGPVYLSGKGFGEVEKDEKVDTRITVSSYKEGLQKTILRLVEAQKRVYYVNENPETGIDPSKCFDRPFRARAARCDIPLVTVMERQKEYLALTQSLGGAEVIPTLRAFCPDDRCHMLSPDGALLYADDDHLSVAGSVYQAKTALRDVLAAMSAREGR